jgi:hypothetical protein
MAKTKKLSKDNPCKGCGARLVKRCICKPKLVKRVLSVADMEARAIKRSTTAEHCNRNRECMLLAGHSRPECFTYADDAELARFRATEMNQPEREGWNDGNCNHQAHVICLRPKGHDGQHAGNPIGKQPHLMGWLSNIGKVYS